MIIWGKAWLSPAAGRSGSAEHVPMASEGADTVTLSNLAEDVQDMQAAQDGPSDGFGEVQTNLCDSIPWGGLSNECNSFFGSPAW